jgi:protein-S-isoprenylcysteine O-methyltransferase Ste14
MQDGPERYKHSNRGSSVRVIAATALFGIVHSALASHAAKRGAAKLLGTRNRNGLYRVFYIAQSVLTFSALADYIRRKPDRVLYESTKSIATAMRMSQAACLAAAIWAAYEVGLSRISGMASFNAWRAGKEVGPEPEAQGPACSRGGRLQANGPFKISRHPLNFWPVPIFFLNPKMTVNLLAFALTALAYLYVGSAHEEARLRATYGDEYRNYQRSGVPFYFPLVRRLIARLITRRLASRLSAERLQSIHGRTKLGTPILPCR